MAITVPRSPLLHSLADGRVLLRSGHRNRPLTGEELRNLSAAKGTADYEQDAVPGASQSDLDAAIITEYAAKRALRSPRSDSLSVSELMRDSGAVDAHGNPTVAGILLFSRSPERLLVQSSAVFVRFGGSTPGGSADRPGYMRREEISGPVSQVIERLWSVILEEMRRESVIRGLEREEVSEYPALPFAKPSSMLWPIATTAGQAPALRCACSATVWKLSVLGGFLVTLLWTTSSMSTFRAILVSCADSSTGASSRSWDSALTG